VRRQQEALHQAVVTRDARIPRFAPVFAPTSDGGCTGLGPVTNRRASALVSDLGKRLRHRKPPPGRVRKNRLKETRDELTRDARPRDASGGEAAALRTELATNRSGRSGGERGDTGGDGRFCRCCTSVAGAKSDRASARSGQGSRRGLLHHDRRLEHHPDLLAGLTSRAISCCSRGLCQSRRRVDSQAPYAGRRISASSPYGRPARLVLAGAAAVGMYAG